MIIITTTIEHNSLSDTPPKKIVDKTFQETRACTLYSINTPNFKITEK